MSEQSGEGLSFSDQVSKTPKIIRGFSKEYSGEERDALALQIRNIRRKRKDPSIETKADTLTATRLQETAREIERIAGIFSNLPPSTIERQMLNNFYERQIEKWVGIPFTKEDIKKYFNEQYLASLTLDEYILLLRRFPSEMVTHVTGQGVQDHWGGVEQRKLGEYSRGFMDMVADGRLRSPLGVYLKDGLTKEAVAQALGLGTIFTTKEGALRYLKNLTRRGQSSNSYADFMAVHFAAEEVANRIYGSEKGNEIFVVFPSAYIASQHIFAGKLTEGGGGQHNDVWVWSKTGNGMDINAGIVFIPADAKVDTTTGSRYKLDENNRAIVNKKYVAAVRMFVESEGFDSFKKESEVVYGKFASQITEEEITQLKNRLAREFGITDPRLQEVLIVPRTLVPLSGYKVDEAEGKVDILDKPITLEDKIQEILQSTGALFEEADNPVSSKEFWKKYFFEHPDQKLSKIVYYTGGDPTGGLIRWREENGLSQRSDEKDLGFSESHISRFGDPRTTIGKNRFRSFAKLVIDEYFAGIRRRQYQMA